MLGAPGSGKSLVAKRIAKILNTKGYVPSETIFDEPPAPPIPGKQWRIVDGYVDKLHERTGIPFGEISTFAHNFAVITDRWVREAEVQKDNCNSITCGTIYESIMYASFSTMFTSAGEGAMMYDQIFYQTMMQALGGFEQRTFDYDAIFWLPWTDKYAADEVNQHTWGAVINAKLPEALDGFGKYAIPLVGSTPARAARATEVIRTIRAAIALAEDEQQAIPDSYSNSASEEHRSESVSDVSPEAE